MSPKTAFFQSLPMHPHPAKLAGTPLPPVDPAAGSVADVRPPISAISQSQAERAEM